MQDATGGASVHINRSPYQQAAPVLLNWRSSPRPDVARLLGKLRRRDRAAESLNTPMHLAESARRKENWMSDLSVIDGLGFGLPVSCLRHSACVE